MKDRIRLVHGDITQMQVDAIVNAANNSLLGGGGVDGAIHRSGGKKILEECEKIGGCDTGNAVITSAGLLSAKFVIHTVGPVWKGGMYNEEQLLASCYRSSLEIATKYQILSVAFPNISTGVYHYPQKEACMVAIKTVGNYLLASPVPMTVFFVCFDKQNYELYADYLLR